MGQPVHLHARTMCGASYVFFNGVFANRGAVGGARSCDMNFVCETAVVDMFGDSKMTEYERNYT